MNQHDASTRLMTFWIDEYLAAKLNRYLDEKKMTLRRYIYTKLAEDGIDEIPLTDEEVQAATDRINAKVQRGQKRGRIRV